MCHDLDQMPSDSAENTQREANTLAALLPTVQTHDEDTSERRTHGHASQRNKEPAFQGRTMARSTPARAKPVSIWSDRTVFLHRCEASSSPRSARLPRTVAPFPIVELIQASHNASGAAVPTASGNASRR